MYCPNCGKELPEGSKFCPECGRSTAPAETPPPAKPDLTVTLNSKTLLVIAGVVIVVLLAVLLLRPGQSNTPAPGQISQTQQTPEPTPTPDPASLLVGTWTNKDGVGLKFTGDGIVKLSGFGLSLGGDTFTYEVTGENTLTLTATVGGILSADTECPYILYGNTLYIGIGGFDFELTKE